MSIRLKRAVSIQTGSGRVKLPAGIKIERAFELLGLDREDEDDQKTFSEAMSPNHWFNDDEDAEPVVVDDDFDDFGDGLQSRTIPQLREYAAQQDPPVDLDGLTRKKDILKAIRNAGDEDAE